MSTQVAVLGDDKSGHSVLLSLIASPSGHGGQVYANCLNETCGWSTIAVTQAQAELEAWAHRRAAT